MIKLYSGTPGSGKSLHVAKDIYEYCSYRKNHLVITNFDVNTSKLKKPERCICLTNSDLKTPDVLIELSKNFHSYVEPLKEDNILLVIDECQLLFNARQWNEDGRKEWISFFTQHRKLGYYIILVAQFDEMIDKQIRSLLEYEVIHRKVTNYGLFGLILRVFALWQEIFIAVEHWYTINSKTAQEFFIARKKYYSLYDTFNTFNSNNVNTLNNA